MSIDSFNLPLEPPERDGLAERLVELDMTRDALLMSIDIMAEEQRMSPDGRIPEETRSMVSGAKLAHQASFEFALNEILTNEHEMGVDEKKDMILGLHRVEIAQRREKLNEIVGVVSFFVGELYPALNPTEAARKLQIDFDGYKYEESDEWLEGRDEWLAIELTRFATTHEDDMTMLMKLLRRKKIIGQNPINPSEPNYPSQDTIQINRIAGALAAGAGVVAIAGICLLRSRRSATKKHLGISNTN